MWGAKLFGYNLTEFWPQGPTSDGFSLMAIDPQRVELGWQPAMWQGQRPKVWTPEKEPLLRHPRFAERP